MFVKQSGNQCYKAKREQHANLGMLQSSIQMTFGVPLEYYFFVILYYRNPTRIFKEMLHFIRKYSIKITHTIRQILVIHFKPLMVTFPEIQFINWHSILTEINIIMSNPGWVHNILQSLENNSCSLWDFLYDKA